MNFFNLDLHASVIEDIKDVISVYDHSVENWSISSHNWVFNKPTKDVDIVNKQTWKHLNEDMCKRFYKRYKSELSNYDGFIVTHTPAFSLLFQEFNKPVIVVASTRYEAPFTTSYNKWKWLNDNLQLMTRNKILYPVANNLYDKKYCEFFTSLEWQHIPSLCNYTKVTWTPEYNSFLVDSKILPLRLRNVSLIYKRQLGRFNWEDIAKYQGIIVFPYNASIMSIFEYYSMGIPLFFPSYSFSLELYKQYRDYGFYSELSWRQVLGMNGGSLMSSDLNDPNNFERIDTMKNWINNSDWYDSEWMPYITYFDSFTDLEEKINSADLKGISKKMHVHNEIRKQKITMRWNQQLNILKYNI